MSVIDTTTPTAPAPQIDAAEPVVTEPLADVTPPVVAAAPPASPPMIGWTPTARQREGYQLELSASHMQGRVATLVVELQRPLAELAEEVIAGEGATDAFVGAVRAAATRTAEFLIYGAARERLGIERDRVAKLKQDIAAARERTQQHLLHGIGDDELSAASREIAEMTERLHLLEGVLPQLVEAEADAVRAFDLRIGIISSETRMAQVAVLEQEEREEIESLDPRTLDKLIELGLRRQALFATGADRSARATVTQSLIGSVVEHPIPRDEVVSIDLHAGTRGLGNWPLPADNVAFAGRAS